MTEKCGICAGSHTDAERASACEKRTRLVFRGSDVVEPPADGWPLAHPLAGDVARAQPDGSSPTIDYLDALLLRLRDASVYHYSDGRITIDIDRRGHAAPSPFRDDYKGKV
jgi:hypothetical protein